MLSALCDRNRTVCMFLTSRGRRTENMPPSCDMLGAVVVVCVSENILRSLATTGGLIIAVRMYAPNNVVVVPRAVFLSIAGRSARM